MNLPELKSSTAAQHVFVEETGGPDVCEDDVHFAADRGFVDIDDVAGGAHEMIEAFLDYGLDHVCDEAVVPNDIGHVGFVDGALDFEYGFSDSDVVDAGVLVYYALSDWVALNVHGEAVRLVEPSDDYGVDQFDESGAGAQSAVGRQNLMGSVALVFVGVPGVALV